MSGWVPMSAEWWPEVAEALPKPWPPGAAAFHLRWLEDQRKRLPGRPALRKLFGWTDWKVKQLLKSEGIWRDPKHKKSQALTPPARRQRTASEPPAHRQPTTSPEKGEAEESPGNRQPTASAPPADRQPTASEPPHAYYPPSPSPSHSPSQEQGAPPGAEPVSLHVEKSMAPDGWQQLADLWNQLAKANGGGPSRLTRSKGLGAKLKARLKDHGHDAMASLLRWYWTSQHDRARFLREKQMGLKTLLRPDNCEEYVSFAQLPETWDASNARGGHIDRSRRGEMTDAERERRQRLLDELRAKQAAQAAEGAP